MGIDEIHLIIPRCVMQHPQQHHHRHAPEPGQEDSSELPLQPAKEVGGANTLQWTCGRRTAMRYNRAVLPDARIVIDKFHVVRWPMTPWRKVRKSLREQLTPSNAGPDAR